MSDDYGFNRWPSMPGTAKRCPNCATLTAERDALRAKIDGSYVQNCIIEPRPGDGPLFNGDGYCARLHGYAIVDREKYEALRADLKACAEALRVAKDAAPRFTKRYELFSEVLSRPGVQAILHESNLQDS